MARPLASVALDAADSSYEDTLDECNGFDTTPTTVLDQARVVNRALVGVSTVGGVLHVAVAVRGTHKIPENVIQDIDFPPVEVKSRLQQAEHPLQGAHVHRGFQVSAHPVPPASGTQKRSLAPPLGRAPWPCCLTPG